MAVGDMRAGAVGPDERVEAHIKSCGVTKNSFVFPCSEFCLVKETAEHNEVILYLPEELMTDRIILCSRL